MRVFSLLCFILFVEGCSIKSSDNSAGNQDSVVMADEPTIVSAPPIENPRGKAELEEAMKSLNNLSNPKSILNGISRLSFISEMKYTGETITYFVNQKAYLRYFISVMTEEGGYQETRYEEYAGDGPLRNGDLIRIMYKEFNGGNLKGAFGFRENDRLVFHKMTFDGEENPIVTSEAVDSISRNRDFQTHVDAVIKNSTRFKLKGGTYQYYLRQDTVKGENEYYEIDSTLFNRIVKQN